MSYHEFLPLAEIPDQKRIANCPPELCIVVRFFDETGQCAKLAYHLEERIKANTNIAEFLSLEEARDNAFSVDVAYEYVDINSIKEFEGF